MKSIYIQQSIYNNCNENSGFLYLHFPLLYVTNCQLLIQIYADACYYVPKLLGISKKVYIKKIDNLVIEYTNQTRDLIHLTAFQNFNNYKFLKRIKKIIDIIYIKLPVLIEEMEKLIKNKQKLPFQLIKKIYKMLFVLIAINDLNFVIETSLNNYLNVQNDKDKILKFISKNNFSHFKFYSDNKNALNKNSSFQDYQNFCWNIGFLENKTGDISIFENNNYLKKFTNNKISLKNIQPEKFSYPNISLNIKRDEYRKYPVFIILTKILQNNMEYRHYWLLRFFRNLRYYYNYNDKIINEWTLNQYEQNSEIK